jgi:hypothetical protein
MRARPLLPVLLALAAVLVAAPARPAAAGTRLAEREADGGPRVAFGHAILVDADGGAVLWGRGSRAPRPPASLTKMLTALAVRGSLDLDEQVTASLAAAGAAGGGGPGPEDAARCRRRAGPGRRGRPDELAGRAARRHRRRRHRGAAGRRPGAAAPPARHRLT